MQASRKDAEKLFANGKFADALAAFQTLLETIPLTVVDTRRQADDVKELLTACREYHTGLRCEIERRKVPPSPPPTQTALLLLSHHSGTHEIPAARSGLLRDV